MIEDAQVWPLDRTVNLDFFPKIIILYWERDKYVQARNVVVGYSYHTQKITTIYVTHVKSYFRV